MLLSFEADCILRRPNANGVIGKVVKSPKSSDLDPSFHLDFYPHPKQEPKCQYPVDPDSF